MNGTQSYKNMETNHLWHMDSEIDFGGNYWAP